MKTDPPAYAQLTAALAPLGITRNDKGEADGTDVEPTIQAGAPWVSLNQDGTRYFDWHHTPDDTLDKIDPGAAPPECRRLDRGARHAVGRNRIGSRNSRSGVEPCKPREETMRIALAIPLLLLGACNVTKDGNAVTVPI